MKSKILGPDGRPLEREVLVTEVAGPTIGGVRPIATGHPAEGLTPERIGVILRQAEQGDPIAYFELAEDLEERFIQYRAVLNNRRLAVAQLEVMVEAASDDPVDQANAELVRDALAELDMADVVYDLLDGIGKGYAVAEIIWQLTNGHWMPAAVEWRDPRWFVIDRRDGKTLRIRDEALPEGRDLPPAKFLVHQPTVKSGLPIRAGLARPACWLHLFQAFGWKDWLGFLEVYGHPLRLGKYHAGASNEEKATLLRAVRSISTDFAAIVPESMVIEFVKADGATGNADLYDRLMSRVEQLTSKLVLGQTATTDAIAGGHAVGKEHREVQGDIRHADARQVSATLTRSLARPIVDLNRGPQKLYPRIRVGQQEGWDAATMMPAVEAFVRLGGRVSMSVIRDKLGLPDPVGDEELLGTPSVPAVADPPAPVPSLQSATPRVEPERDLVDGAVEALLADWEPQLGPAVTQVLKAAEGAASFEEFLAKLDQLQGNLDLERLREDLARTATMSRVAARAGVPLAEGNPDA